MFNMFEEVKKLLKPTDVVRFYLGEGKYKSGSYWYVSPFRNEKTASFCVNDKKGIHDFGDSKHYDIVSFVSSLFELRNTDSVKKLKHDFNLPIQLGEGKPRIFYERDLKLFKEELAKKEKEKKIKQDYYEDIYDLACNNFKRWNEIIFCLQSQRDILADIDLYRIYYMKDYSEWIVDNLAELDFEQVWENKEYWEEMVL